MRYSLGLSPMIALILYTGLDGLLELVSALPAASS